MSGLFLVGASCPYTAGGFSMREPNIRWGTPEKLFELPAGEKGIGCLRTACASTESFPRPTGEGMMEQAQAHQRPLRLACPCGRPTGLPRSP